MYEVHKPISIHALLAESDFLLMWYQCNTVVFLSTLSLRRATPETVPRRPHADISIHALLAESDHDSYVVMEATKVISIHALLAESDTALKTIKALFDTISIHALLAESDYRLPLLHTSYSNFYPRSPCGERP